MFPHMCIYCILVARTGTMAIFWGAVENLILYLLLLGCLSEHLLAWISEGQTAV